MSRKLLGEILLSKNLLTDTDLAEALSIQRDTGERLGRILISLGKLKEKDLVLALSEQLKLPIAQFEEMDRMEELIKILPPSLINRYQILPLYKKEETLAVAMSDPLDILAIDEISEKTNLNLKIFICGEKEIENIINSFYGFKEIETQFSQVLSEKKGEYHHHWQIGEGRPDESLMIRLVNTIIRQGVRLKASDIHIEPKKNNLRVRYRIDGILRQVMKLPLEYLPPLVSRVKIMAGMDIAEKRLPQDGRLSLKVNDKSVNLRLSIIPMALGEKVVARVLEEIDSLITLDKIGFSAPGLKEYHKLLANKEGLILAVGPTGSGKSATLYASLAYLNQGDVNITTIEDPVEYILTGINQMGVNNRAGLDFAAGLRAILRQDPDVIMVGEIRDKDTAEIAIRAAITGHLVLSTLHTADAPGAVTRLLDMGIEPFLVASSLKGVIAQRLVRRICGYCQEEYSLDPNSQEGIFLEEMGYPQPEKMVQGHGCHHCNYTGYKGRTAILEILPINASLREGIMGRKTREELKGIAFSAGLFTLQEDGIQKAFQGITTIKEVLRVAYIDEF